MAISESEFDDWLLSHDKEPVYLLEIDGEKPDDTPVTIRASSQPYDKGENIYRSRLLNYEIERSFRLNNDNKSNIGASVVDILNEDGKLDDWKNYRLGEAVLKMGDLSWDLDDYRVFFTGTGYQTKINFKTIRFSLADEKQRINKIVAFADYPSALAGNKLPGVAIYNLLTANSVFSAGEIRTDDLDQLDIDFPYNIDVDVPGDGENLISVVDRCIPGFLHDVQMFADGKIGLVSFNEVTGSTDIPGFSPTGRSGIKVDLVNPIGEVISRGYDANNPLQTFENATTKSKYNDQVWRSVEIGVEVLTFSERPLAADKIMDRFDEVLENVTIPTARDVLKLNLGDEVIYTIDRFGYQDGKHGILTRILDRMNQPKLIGAHFEQS